MYHLSSDGSCGKTITLARDPVEFSGRGKEGEKRRRRKKGERKRRSRGGKFEGKRERRRGEENGVPAVRMETKVARKWLRVTVPFFSRIAIE